MTTTKPQGEEDYLRELARMSAEARSEHLARADEYVRRLGRAYRRATETPPINLGPLDKLGALAVAQALGLVPVTPVFRTEIFGEFSPDTGTTYGFDRKTDAPDRLAALAAGYDSRSPDGGTGGLCDVTARGEPPLASGVDPAVGPDQTLIQVFVSRNGGSPELFRQWVLPPEAAEETLAWFPPAIQELDATDATEPETERP